MWDQYGVKLIEAYKMQAQRTITNFEILQKKYSMCCSEPKKKTKSIMRFNKQKKFGYTVHIHYKDCMKRASLGLSPNGYGFIGKKTRPTRQTTSHISRPKRLPTILLACRRRGSNSIRQKNRMEG